MDGSSLPEQKTQEMKNPSREKLQCSSQEGLSHIQFSNTPAQKEQLLPLGCGWSSYLTYPSMISDISSSLILFR